VLDDPRSDLYAAGVLTWKLLTNSALFSAPTPVMLLMKHAQTPPPTLASGCDEHEAQPHPSLEAFLASLLEKDRNRRFATAATVVDAIAALPPVPWLPSAVVSRRCRPVRASSASSPRRRPSTPMRRR